jgi:hypothetical protein
MKAAPQELFDDTEVNLFGLLETDASFAYVCALEGTAKFIQDRFLQDIKRDVLFLIGE